MPTNLDAPQETKGDWQPRLAYVVETMREMSRQTDPQAMVRDYAERMRRLRPAQRSISLSRRDLDSPSYRITRSTTWKEQINPWKQKDRLPLLQGGLLGELIYGDEPRVIDDLELDPDDPAAEYLEGQKSLIAVPIYDRGAALNMVVQLRDTPAGFDREELPERVWMTNLFGRATHNLVLAEQLQSAYDTVDNELKVVADIQRSLLPAELPNIPTMNLAAHYQTSRRAGGDYYDFFPLPDGKWGILIADVSGHGTPAAVIMAILHSLAHTHPGPPQHAGKMFEYLNHELTTRYTIDRGTFVTAFYGVYDPTSRSLTYCSAGHNPPRVKHCAGGTLSQLDGAQELALGIEPVVSYHEATKQLAPGDQIIFYTDGITEAWNRTDEMFGEQRLDAVLGDCGKAADELIQAVLLAVETFTDGRPADDDRTLLVAKIT